jgi:predicted metal-binding protein
MITSIVVLSSLIFRFYHCVFCKLAFVFKVVMFVCCVCKKQNNTGSGSGESTGNTNIQQLPGIVRKRENCISDFL